MPDLIRHPGQFWIPAFAGMTALTYIVAGVIMIRQPNTTFQMDILNFTLYVIVRRYNSREAQSG